MHMKLLAATAAALAVASMAAIAAPAHASSGDDETCVGTVSATYNPGITYTPESTDFSVTDTYDTCTGSDATITSGQDSESFQVTLSCNLLEAGLTVETVHWSNGNESVIAFGSIDVSTTLTAQIIVLNGTVVSGEFTGDTVVQTNEFLLTNLLGCSSPTGLTSLSGTTEFELTGV
jgi:hypothetical protein